MYRIATLFVLPSTYEPFGAVVNEALSAGMPVICTYEVGAKVFIEDGVNGTVVNGNSYEELSKSISTWLSTGETATERLQGFAPSLLPVEFDYVVNSMVETLQATHL